MRRFAFVFTLLALFATNAFAAAVSFDSLDVAGAVSGGANTTASYAYINTLVAGSIRLTPDLAVTNKAGQALNVVGILQNISWNGGVTDPIMFTCVVSANNANVLQSYASSTKSNVQVRFTFGVLAWDASSTWYRAFDSNSVELAGVFSAPPNGLQFGAGISTLPFANGMVQISAMPPTTVVQRLMLGAPGSVVTRSWGVTVR